jgi:DNA polymerase III epsilon subunit-like protein
MTGRTDEWTTGSLSALDLEGSGAQDHDDEAILEIAVVPLIGGQPDAGAAYTTLINPGRGIRRRPWISPGLTNAALAAAPSPGEVEHELAHRVNRQILVGHNIGVDWRLLHRRHPAIRPTALLDTLRLARHLKLGGKNSLGALTAQFGLRSHIERLADGSQPHRALWDAIAAALLLPVLIAKTWPDGATLADLLGIAAVDHETASSATCDQLAAQGTLFDGAG